MLNLLTRFAKGLQLCSEVNVSKVHHQDWRSFGRSSKSCAVVRNQRNSNSRKSFILQSNSSFITGPNEAATTTTTPTASMVTVTTTPTTSLTCSRSMSTCSPIARRFLASTNLGSGSCNPIFLNNGNLSSISSGCLNSSLKNVNAEQRAGMATLQQMHISGPHIKKRPPRKPLDGKPQMKGVVLKTLIKKPKKPNSANRKCVLVRLTNGKEKVAYVPGQGHNLQEHNIVLCRVGRLRDVPGVKIKCIRGKYDLPHVQKIAKV